MKFKKVDLRIRRTKESIRQAFEEMICEMEYEKITVKELAKRAKINRKTFYLHYNSLEDLLCEVQNEMMQNFIERIRDLDPIEDVEEITREFYTFHDEYGEFGERITCSDKYRFLNQRMMKTVMDESWKKKKSQMEPDLMGMIMTFISESTLAIYREWIDNGKKISKEKMIELTSKLINEGIKTLT